MDRFGGGWNIVIWAGVFVHTKLRFFVSSIVLEQEGIRMTFSDQFLSFSSWTTETWFQHKIRLHACHTDRTPQQFLEASNICVLPWPAKPLDLNPIDKIRIGKKKCESPLRTTKHVSLIVNKKDYILFVFVYICYNIKGGHSVLLSVYGYLTKLHFKRVQKISLRHLHNYPTQCNI